jgi:hypothetical protein
MRIAAAIEGSAAPVPVPALDADPGRDTAELDRGSEPAAKS